MAAMGTMHSDSMRAAAEKPARICVPKPLTTDCTSIMPMETVDCCRMDGRATRVMARSSPKRNRPFERSGMRRSSSRNTPNDSTADRPCARNVA